MSIAKIKRPVARLFLTFIVVLVAFQVSTLVASNQVSAAICSPVNIPAGQTVPEGFYLDEATCLQDPRVAGNTGPNACVTKGGACRLSCGAGETTTGLVCGGTEFVCCQVDNAVLCHNPSTCEGGFWCGADGRRTGITCDTTTSKTCQVNGATVGDGSCAKGQRCIEGNLITDTSCNNAPEPCLIDDQCDGGLKCVSNRCRAEAVPTLSSCDATCPGSAVLGCTCPANCNKTTVNATQTCGGTKVATGGGGGTGGGGTGGTGGGTPGITPVSCNVGAKPNPGDNSCIVTSVTATNMAFRCNLKTIGGSHTIAHRWERCRTAGTAPCNENDWDYIASGDLAGDSSNWAISCGQELTGSGTFDNFGCGRVQVDVQMSAPGTSVAGLVYNYGSNCPTGNTPPGTPQIPPSPTTPSGPQCLSITMSNQSPRIGDTVTFTCGNVAGASRYRFRLIDAAGAVIEPLATGRTSAPVSITQAGSYRAQCTFCTGPDNASCHQFEPLTN